MENLIPYLIIFTGLFILLTVFKKVYKPRISGALGEYFVARTLRRLNKEDYIVYNNIHLKNKGRTSQIDHLVISIYGIFVIETKNYKGWIFGNEKSKYWTQTLYRKKYKLYNPVIQNWAHVNFLKNLSRELNTLKYFPIVVFAGNAKLKKISASIPVIRRHRLITTIKRNREIHLTHEQLFMVDGIIKASIISGNNIKREHKRNVKKNVKRNKANKNTHICPNCGGKLEIKNGKYGRFQGCSNFPRCKFTRNIQ